MEFLKYLRGFRLIPSVESYPSIVSFVQTLPGKTVLLIFFSLGLQLTTRNQAYFPPDMTLDAALVLGALTFWPDYRRELLMVFGAYWFVRFCSDSNLMFTEVLKIDKLLFFERYPALYGVLFPLGGLMFTVGIIFLAYRYPNSRLMRRPIRNLILGYLSILLAFSYVPMPRILHAWLSFVLIMPRRLFWYLGYFLIDAKENGEQMSRANLGYPLFAPSHALFPIPKGPNYVRKIEARDSQQLAIVQLKGTKLIFWTYVLSEFRNYFDSLVHGPKGDYASLAVLPFHLNIPLLWEAALRANVFSPLSWYANWLALFSNFTITLLEFAVTMNVFVAIVRMSGFNALRYMHRPLASQSLAEFWNRIAYYYKEMLLEFFFYPFFTRHFRDSPRFRLSVSIFFAAGIGSVIYIFFREMEALIFLDPLRTLSLIRSMVFHSLFLGVAIACSRLLELPAEKRRTPSTFSILTAARVFVFYCVISVFDNFYDQKPIAYHLRFLLSLFTARKI